jgi:hypothetical protein
LGGKNNSPQTTGVREMMRTRQSRGNDDVNNVLPCLPNTQQPTIGSGYGGGNKGNEEEEYNGC